MPKLKIESDVKSFTMIKNAIIDSEDILNEHEKILYIVLMRYGNKAFPSFATLSKKCGFSKRTAQRTIDTLIGKGLLKKRNRVSKKGGNTSNIYTLIDDDRIWKSTEENLKENVDAAKLEEAIKIIELAGMKVLGKGRGLASDTDQSIDASTQNKNQQNKHNIPSTDKDSTKESESQAERYTLEDIKKLFDYSILIIDHPNRKEDIELIFGDILYDTLNTTKKSIRIGGEDKPSEVVKSRLLKLTYYDIAYAISKFHAQTTEIKNTRSYLLTILYHAREQSYLDLMNTGHRNGDF